MSTTAGSPAFCVRVCGGYACNVRLIYVLLDMTKSCYIIYSYFVQKLNTFGLAFLCI